MIPLWGGYWWVMGGKGWVWVVMGGYWWSSVVGLTGATADVFFGIVLVNISEKETHTSRTLCVCM